MSSTNKTTNYELSQYIGTDKPTYLGDYNADMLKIDTAIKGNADDIGTNTTAINTVITTANTALNKAEANETAITTVTSTANSALAKANQNEAKITALESNVNVVASETKIGKLGNDDLYRTVLTFTTTNEISATGWHQFDIPFTTSNPLKRIYKVNGSYDMSGIGSYNAQLPGLATNGGIMAINQIGFNNGASGGYVRIRTYNYGVTTGTEFEFVIEYTMDVG